MKSIVTFSLGLALFTAPVAAQITGGINRGAPVLESSIKFADQTELEVKYTAIHFGEGQWQSVLEQKDQYEKFNKLAMSKPIGQVETSATVVASGREIPAGDYDMYFSLHAEAGWLLNLKSKANPDAEPIRWRLVMSDSDENCKRLRFNINAGDEKNAASLTVAFGKKKVTVPVTVKKADKKGDEKAEKKSGN